MPSSPPLPPQPIPESYKIVVGIDYSAPSVSALRSALDLALHREVQIYAVTVAEGYGPGRPAVESAEMRQTFHDEAQQTLDRWLSGELDTLEASGAKLNRKRVASVVDFGKPADGIIALAEDVNADLIVVGTHGRTGLERLMVGSVANDVLRRSSCPVLIAR
jgi:universal stress protein A